MSRVVGPGPPAEEAFDAEEEREAEALLSGTGSGADGGISIPWPVLFHRRVHHRVAGSDRYQWWVLWTVLAGLLSVNITFTVFVVALPQVAHELHTTVSTLTWTSTGPLLAFGVAAPVLGKLGDLRGYRRLYLAGLFGAAVSVVLTASAPTAGVLIAARLFDGVQGAATGAASMALVLQDFSHEDRVKAMGWWALVGAGGPVLGVTIGAPIIQYYGWRALFWGELPLMAIAAVLAVVVLPARDRTRGAATPQTPAKHPRRASPWRELDWLGSVDPLRLGDRRTARAQPRSLVGIRLTEDARLCSRLSVGPRGRLRAPRAARAEAAHPAALLPACATSSSRSAPRAFGQLRLHGRVLPLPHPHGARLRLQRDRGRPAVDRPPAHVLVVGSHRRVRRGQGGGAVVDRRRGRLRPRLDGRLHPARRRPLGGGDRRRARPLRAGQRDLHARRPWRRPRTRSRPTSSG